MAPYLTAMLDIEFILGSDLGGAVDEVDGSSILFRGIPGCLTSIALHDKGAIAIAVTAA